MKTVKKIRNKLKKNRIKILEVATIVLQIKVK